MAITTNATVVFHQRQLGTNGGNFIYCIMPVSPALAIVTTFRNYHASSLTSVKYFHKSASLLPETSVISLCLICIYLDVTPWTQDALFSVATTLNLNFYHDTVFLSLQFSTRTADWPLMMRSNWPLVLNHHLRILTDGRPLKFVFTERLCRPE